MNKLTDTEIVKSLELLLDKMRAYESLQASIGKGLVEDIISMYNRQKAEIERLTKKYSEKCISNKKVEWYAMIALREKCIEHQDFHKGDDGVFRAYISIEDLDRIIDEM